MINLINTGMKKFIYFITSALMLFGCAQSTISSDDQKPEQLTTDTISKTDEDHLPSSIHRSNLFTLSDAEKILGEPAHITDSTSKIKGEDVKYIDSMSIIKKDASIFSCSYMSNSKDIKTEKTGTVYFLCEQYPQVSLAQKVYSFYKTANENNGIEILHNIGDEAYFHSDKQNFYFIMVRKDKIVFNMKVNKITSKTSLEEFNLLAKKITDAL